jgi:hypothetical protein
MDPLSTTAGAAVGADEAAFLIYECLLAAVGTGLSFGNGTILYIFLQGTLYTYLPGVDALAVELQ